MVLLRAQAQEAEIKVLELDRILAEADPSSQVSASPDHIIPHDLSHVLLLTATCLHHCALRRHLRTLCRFRFRDNLALSHGTPRTLLREV